MWGVRHDQARFAVCREVTPSEPSMGKATELGEGKGALWWWVVLLAGVMEGLYPLFQLLLHTEVLYHSIRPAVFQQQGDLCPASLFHSLDSKGPRVDTSTQIKTNLH